MGFPDGTVVKNSPANGADARDMGSVPGLGRSTEIWQPIPIFLPGESHQLRRLAATIHAVAKEVDTTEHARTHTDPLSFSSSN